MPDSALPSLFAACHEEPYGDGGGFASWPKTKWWWGGALSNQPPNVWTTLHRGKGLILSARGARLVAPLCSAELAAADAGEHGEDARRLVAHLADAGPSTTEELKEELGLDAAAFRRVRDRLARVGAIVSRGLRVELPGGRHRHTSEYRRWDVPGAGSAEAALRELVVLGVRAAVIAPEREVLRWFSWPVPADALGDERLARPESGWVAAA